MVGDSLFRDLDVLDLHNADFQTCFTALDSPPSNPTFMMSALPQVPTVW